MPIKFAIAGCGHIAKRHAAHILAQPEAELVACHDLNSEKGTEFAQQYNIPHFDTLDSLLEQENIDILNICTPNGAHYEISMKAMEAGKHTLVEKPMALRADHCEEMIKASLIHNRQLFVVKQNRYNPPIAALKKLILENRLGKVYFVSVNCFWNRNKEYYLRSDWKGTKQLDGGTLFTQFSHFVDIFYYLFGDVDTQSIHGITSNVSHRDLIEFEDTGSFTFRFKSGALGSLNYTTSAFEKNMEGSITVFAENATIKVGGQYLNTMEYQQAKDFIIDNVPSPKPANDYGYYQGSMSNHDLVISNVVNTLQGREKIMTNAMEGLKVVEIIEKMYMAANRSEKH
jgi:UDP-N-acetyl-2-amino-2-deoxyglucuronate dehydrogenase